MVIIQACPGNVLCFTYTLYNKCMSAGRKNLSPILRPLFLLALIFISIGLVKTTADNNCDVACLEKKASETQSKLDSTRQQISSVQNTISQLLGQLNVTASQLNEVQDSINQILEEINVLDSSLKDRYQKLSAKIDLRNKLIRTYAKKSALSDLEIWLSNGFSISAFLDVYNKAFNSDTVQMIGTLNNEITGFEKDKAAATILRQDLEKTQNQLVSLKNDLANKKSSAQSQANSLEEQSSAYEKQLEDLQSKILALKSSDENGSVGNYESPSARTPDPPFSGKAFAAFSYGAYTHYNGMSQYGALGRAKAGQKYTDILKFYYKVGTKPSGKKDKDATISVQGYGNMSYEKYLWGIAEMPSNWNIEAQKAQAVAARTYAYRSAKPICTTQACQVFNKSKSDNAPELWKQAIKETDGIILNNPTTSQYSSTTGGYINNIGWDVKGDWPGGAYEKKAGSPWFYKAWYTSSYSNSSSCGHAYPWLTEKEMADILNSYVVWSKGSSKDKSHISPTTTSCWGGGPYSLSEMSDAADKYGDSYSSVSGVKANISNGGYTSTVTFSTDHGSVTINGSDFKTVYNLRAPGYVSIKSRLFDLEMQD